MTDTANSDADLCFCVPKHPTVDCFGVEIDEELAPLILLLWGDEIDTMECCQHCETLQWGKDADPIEIARISFNSFMDADLFVQLLHWTLQEPWSEDFDFFGDVPTPAGFRIYTWYQPCEPVNNHPPYLAPTTVVEFPRAAIGDIVEGLRGFGLTATTVRPPDH